MTELTSTAKETLRKSVRRLRTSLVTAMAEAAQREYRLDLEIDKAKLPEARRCRRERLEAWLTEQSRVKVGKAKAADKALVDRALQKAATEAAHTLLNRLVLLRILEHHGLLQPAVVTGAWDSDAYANQFREMGGPLLEIVPKEDTRGLYPLLQAVFAELALELPALFGDVGLTALFPVRSATLGEILTVLNDPDLASAWGDDTTLGWVYQYWNDPDREALDQKIAGGGKIEPHEIAQKTQMFTERYMVEWLLQNSLGPAWLSICRTNGWKADALDILPQLEERRATFRARRDAGAVPAHELMPIHGALEHAWKYFVPPVPHPPAPSPQRGGGGEAAPKSGEPADPGLRSIRDLKLLDPACGSGHFLVIAFDLLVHMYQEEARHRGEAWSNESIAERILAVNLHGIDIDPRAIQIAAAALWLKAKLFAPEARLTGMQLVAPSLRIAHLPESDPALATLFTELDREGLPKVVVRSLVKALAGVDYLGTLLRVDRAAEDALREAWGGGDLGVEAMKGSVLEKIEAFLTHHSTSEDLGVRLDGEQLASGARFMRMVKEGTYDIVVGNPPYQGLSKTSQFEYVAKHYPRGKADLYAAFLERSFELAKPGGLSALLTMRGWMFLGQFAELRKRILHEFDIRSIGDFAVGAFDDVPNDVLSVCVPVIRTAAPSTTEASMAIQPTPYNQADYDRARTSRKRAAVLAQVGRYEFDPKGFAVIDGEPIVYWWTKEFLERYAKAPKLCAAHRALNGLSTQNNVRFLRKPWETRREALFVSKSSSRSPHPAQYWLPYIKGGEGAEWVEGLSWIVRWAEASAELRIFLNEYQMSRPGGFIKHESRYLQLGVAVAVIGASFSARAHAYQSIFGHMGTSIFPEERAALLCLLNSSLARGVLESLNPSVHFLASDVDRLPILPVSGADEIVQRTFAAFEHHERSTEELIGFHSPGASPWRYAQSWAQLAVDRPEGAPLPPYEPVYDPPAPEAHVSFAIGVALGRFGANGEGILTTAPADALPAGILFIGPGDRLTDSLETPACKRIVEAWDTHRTAILGTKKQELRDWLRNGFFAHHKSVYENRPIYFPLSSAKREFVAWISIHRWNDETLKTLLSGHVDPLLRQLKGELADMNVARASSDKATARNAERNYEKARRGHDELEQFRADIALCAERGAPPADAACTKREVDAPFSMDLDDGVMINSAALWPLLAPQWADPKKWWKQLCQADGKKDYDWAHLAKRYFPTRVDAKCKVDPSLAVAHGCFWKYHPAKAYAWELRLQDEIRPEFTIDEEGSDAARAAFVAAKPEEVAAIETKERTRRERKAKQAEQADEPADASEDGEAEEAGDDEEG